MRYLEDFSPGEVITHPGVTISREEIVAFAEEFDPQPFHLSDEAASETFMGSLCASGWHTCSVMMRMICEAYVNDSASMGAPGLDEVKWLAPVRPGDHLSMKATCLEARVSRSRPDLGLVRFTWDLYNQNGEHMLTATGTGMFATRNQDDAA